MTAPDAPRQRQIAESVRGVCPYCEERHVGQYACDEMIGSAAMSKAEIDRSGVSNDGETDG